MRKMMIFLVLFVFESGIVHAVDKNVISVEKQQEEGFEVPTRLKDLDLFANRKLPEEMGNSTHFKIQGNRVFTFGVAVESDNNIAKIWDLEGNCLSTYGVTKSVSSAIFNPQGNRILTTSCDGSAKLWDLNGNCLATLLETPIVNTAQATFTFHSDRIIATVEGNPIGVWDLNGNRIGTIIS